jgi:hypothetical protein
MIRAGFFLTGIALATVAIAAPRPIAEPSSLEARATLAAAASCIAKASPEATADLLTSDFRTTAYRGKMDRVVDHNRRCIKAKWIRANRLLLAGALAEELLMGDPAPLNTRLARNAAVSGATALSPSDHVVMCVARSDPDGTARLFATVPGSPEEGVAAQSLALVTSRCAEGGPKLSVSSAGLRSMLATASYRLLAAKKA